MGKWQRIKYHPVLPLGEDGRLVTGSEEHIRLSHHAAAEGMVLLKNEGGMLPLVPQKRVALFGKGCADYVKGGGGSGDVTVKYVRSFCDAMQLKHDQGKLELFEPMNRFYLENVAQQRKEGRAPGHTVEPQIPGELLHRAAQHCDTAVISICRFSSEAWDRKGQKNDGDFYLSPEEQKMVEDVCAAFEDIIVVLNVGGMVDTSWFISNPKIKAVLLAWQGGMEGALAQADILCGDVNPSGKLVDTFAASFDDYPSSYNFNESDDYVCYTDDVFVGYRYFETIPGAAEKVNYPFGFGLSYTTFDIVCLDAVIDADQIHITVRVTNTGSRAGKEVVQLYSSAPQCRLQMPSLELRAFRKTQLLQPGEVQEFVLSVKLSELASYDEQKAAYILFEGGYTLKLGNCVRNLTDVYTYENTQEKIVSQLKNRCVPSKLPCRLKADGTYEALTVRDPAALPDHEDWPPKAYTGQEHILPDTRTSADLKNVPVLEMVARGEMTMDEFLEAMTDDELITLLGGCANQTVADTSGFGDIPSRGIPAAMTADGPAGLRIRGDRGVCTTAFPVATLLACTWDPELIYHVGEAGAKEVKENNMAIWLTPAINIHRSPLCGRNFEYYSEDPLLAGKLAAAMVRGIQSQNIAAAVKHFCVNNKETNRKGSDSRVSERALREIYLKAFEIVVKEGKVWSVMTAYNLLNGTYTSENTELITGILRGEWGFDGLVMTDWHNWAEHYREALAGNDVRMPEGSAKRLQRALAEGYITRADLKVNARRVLELLLKFD